MLFFLIVLAHLLSSVSQGHTVDCFYPKFEYNRTSTEGRIVSDALNRAGIQCFDGKSAYSSFHKIMHRYDDYVDETKNALDMFKEYMAIPVSAGEWHREYKKKMLKYRVEK